MAATSAPDPFDPIEALRQLAMSLPKSGLYGGVPSGWTVKVDGKTIHDGSKVSNKTKKATSSNYGEGVAMSEMFKVGDVVTFKDDAKPGKHDPKKMLVTIKEPGFSDAQKEKVNRYIVELKYVGGDGECYTKHWTIAHSLLRLATKEEKRQHAAWYPDCEAEHIKKKTKFETAEVGMFAQAIHDICGHGYGTGTIVQLVRSHDDQTVGGKTIKAFVTKSGSWIRADEFRMKRKLVVNSDELFNKVKLPDAARAAVLEAIHQTNSEAFDRIFKTWGFDEMLEKGKGVAMLFFGPPGTGKTMMGEAIAQKLGRALRIIGSAEIFSSEPGGAERAIKAFFSEAKKKNMVLLFDECDSLIYNRQHVGMILAAQINCILSEIERFDGVCIFTTNNVPVLDAAFERRLSLKLEFPKPDKETRLAIWQAFFKKKTVLAKDVDLKEFARYKISGGQIKNIVLNAARRAAYLKHKRITAEDIQVALEREQAGSVAFSAIDRHSPTIVQDMVMGEGRGLEVEQTTEVKDASN